MTRRGEGAAGRGFTMEVEGPVLGSGEESVGELVVGGAAEY